ncbi:MAG: N-acetylmannosamine-6-phosphate 2-epimerase [Jaaginema sp. PMC 1079.18]|nr:N-acetylmannosamine-6-phosphate 2-epimerase [Jaaginema sp. PMC 1080.18]MEC4853431.1 N-acetylmannosamine-6-phosphate 2-epimerase [Jaaginema sp. PMC 1079.18]MEC4865313.1 N-acetylmannosamine-6-phosphate 2-epimerase [Jaaginema sp. PMC 1078.18]
MAKTFPLPTLQNSLIVSCQAPLDSPLHDADIIAAIAKASVLRGAKGVRIDTPSHVAATRGLLPDTPIIGLWKQTLPGYDVYITPRFEDAIAIAQAGADMIALDATQRSRPNHETVATLISRIHDELGKPVMADIDTLENAQLAQTAGADIIGTTLYGYTGETQALTPPGWELLQALVAEMNVPVICEGGITSPEMAAKALNLGADAIVVGGAITGVDLKVQAFLGALSG